MISTFSENPNEDYFNANVVKIMDNNFSDILSKYTDYLAEEALKPKK